MLTFRFSKADGQMTVGETLTSGMVGKKVKLEFSDDWAGLQKTVVFSADCVSRDVVNAGEEVVIPHEVLERSRCHLYVGVYGISGDGRVIPTIRVQGPLIQPGADPTGDRGTEPSLPVWGQLQAQIDAFKGGLTQEASALLMEILRSAVYRNNQSESIDALGTVLGCPDNFDGGEAQ